MTIEHTQAVSPDAPDTGGHASQQVTVLVADDDDGFRETLCLWLANEDPYETTEAPNGAQAVERLDGTVDVLVLDRRMPKLSGPEVVDRLDETPFDGPVIVISANKPDSNLCESDVTAYLAKPIDQSLFLDTMRRSLSSESILPR